jgi:alkylhydroperoxidase family enzyme
MKIIPNKSTDNYEPRDVLDRIRARRGAAGLFNLDRMLIHSPPLADGWNSFIGKVRQELELPAKLRELAICTVAILTGAEYELHHHAPLWLEHGASARQAEALKRLNENQALAEFDPTERAVVQLTIEMTRQVEVSEQSLRAVRAALGSDRQLVELIGVIAAYNMVARFIVATGVEIERTQRA